MKAIANGRSSRDRNCVILKNVLKDGIWSITPGGVMSSQQLTVLFLPSEFAKPSTDALKNVISAFMSPSSVLGMVFPHRILYRQMDVVHLHTAG